MTTMNTPVLDALVDFVLGLELAAVPPAVVEAANRSMTDWLGTAIRGSMPQNAPDSLGDQAYIDLLAYLLNANGSPTGSSDLPSDVNALMQISVTSQQQKR